MQKKYPLLIGTPSIYKLIDFELLKNNSIEPILTYPMGIKPLTEENNAYYQSLTIDEISKIIEINDNYIDAITCFNDNFLIETAQIRTKYDIPGIQYPEIQKFKVKSEMYRVLSPYISVPQTMSCHEDLNFEDIVEYLGEGEYFIKPDNLAGAEGSCHIRNKIDYLNWKNTCFNSNNASILQKFYAYPLVHCELIVKNGDVKYIQARQYSYPNHLFLSGKIIASFPIVEHEIQLKIEQLAVKVQQHLGYENGVMHTEFFLGDNHELIFLETNIRQAGGAINMIHRRRAGIGFETAMILLELDREVLITLNEGNYDLGGYIPMKKGRVTKICVPILKGQYTFDVKVGVGDYCDAPKSASNAAVSFVGYCSTYDDLINDFCSIENNDIVQQNSF